ncbi:hypothetical protein L6452_19421 [Arctium lappa]|uniref:Uncharacterized protein n=1 Tax=Arctium lappa TaxID=4217 RepID=A0ACB9B7T1_ARCLA|nr:hypothetical protein L6452_19421 [Arctium lappa]
MNHVPKKINADEGFIKKPSLSCFLLAADEEGEIITTPPPHHQKRKNGRQRRINLTFFVYEPLVQYATTITTDLITLLWESPSLQLLLFLKPTFGNFLLSIFRSIN